MSNLTRAVDVAEAIAGQLLLGFEPDVSLVAEAEDLGISVEAIRNKLKELEGDYDEEC